jgi:hypothetical protein
MSHESQSELFIRTLADFLDDLRVHQMARQRERHRADADRYMTRYGVFANSAEQPTRLTPWGG